MNNIKKITLAVFAVLVLAGNAFSDFKYFVGGAFDYTSHETSDEHSLSFSPYGGYVLNDTSDISFGINAGQSNYSLDVSGNDVSDWSTYGIWAAYEKLLVSVGPLYIYVQGTLSYDNASGKDLAGDDYSYSTIGLSVAPNIQYSLTDRITLWTSLNFLGLNLSRYSGDVYDGQTDFNFGADTDNVVDSGAITIGFNYLF